VAYINKRDALGALFFSRFADVGSFPVTRQPPTIKKSATSKLADTITRFPLSALT
jgi:hypothetical protein